MEMIRRKMPTTIVLLVFSWLITIAGFITAGCLSIFKFRGVNSLLSSLSILLGSLLFATSVRMLGNIGQMLFDLPSFMRKLTNETNDILDQGFNSLTQNIEALRNSSEKLTNETNDILHQGFNSLTQNIEALRNSSDLIISDSKEINKNVRQIKTFFEEVERE